MLRFVDLFAGIGGIRLGLEQSCDELGIKHKCVFSSEIDHAAQQTYQRNFGELPLGDIREITDFPDFDLLLAGFPCQPFSHAGQHKGLQDTRGTLFFEIARILKAKRPSAFILENVRGLTTNDGGRTFKLILQTLNELGYAVEWRLLNSCNFGVPQNRLRLFIVGLFEDSPKLTIQSDKGPSDSQKYKRDRTLFPDIDNSRPTVNDILQPRFPKKYACTDPFVEMLSNVVGRNFESLHGVRLIDYRGGNAIHSWELGLKGVCSTQEVDFMNLLIQNRRKKHFGRDQDGKKLTRAQIATFYHAPDIDTVMKGLLSKGYLKQHGDRFNPVCGNMSFEVFKFIDPESISITLTSSDAHRIGVVQRNKPRRITPRECARLQGFPEDFKCHPIDSSAYRQFGNSVTVPTIRSLALNFLLNNQTSVPSFQKRKSRRSKK